VVSIVSLSLVRESSLLYQNRSLRSPKDSYELFKQYLGDVDREHFVAGIAVGLANHYSIEETLSLASACGTANALEVKTGYVELENVSRFQRETMVTLMNWPL
jgi:hypothetical protein